MSVKLSLFFASLALSACTTNKTKTVSASQPNLTKNFVIDYGADNSFETNDSKKMQRAINQLSKLGGGTLIIPAGNYSLRNITLKSHVHLEFDAQAVVKPSQEGNKVIKPYGEIPTGDGTYYKSFVLFDVSSQQKTPLENVSVKGVGGRFTIDVSESENLFHRVFMVRNVKDFLIANINVKDDYSKYAAIELNGETVKNRILGPKDGVIQNIDLTGAHYGYGLIQMHLGTNIIFENLHGDGGTTLRMESHSKNLRDTSKYTAMNNIIGRNIRCTHGNSAVQISPHYINNGVFDIKDITANGCGWALRIAPGFVIPAEEELGLTPGSFNPRSTVRDIKATFSNTKAQLKKKHHKYLPCDLRPSIAKIPYALFPTGDSMSGPSYGVILNEANYDINIDSRAITQATGFSPQQHYVTTEQAVIDCPM